MKIIKHTLIFLFLTIFVGCKNNTVAKEPITNSVQNKVRDSIKPTSHKIIGKESIILKKIWNQKLIGMIKMEEKTIIHIKNTPLISQQPVILAIMQVFL